MPRQLRAMGKRKPSVDMRYLLIMMRAEETAIQPTQAPAVMACTGQPLRHCKLSGGTHHATACCRNIACSSRCLLAMQSPLRQPQSIAAPPVSCPGAALSDSRYRAD